MKGAGALQPGVHRLAVGRRARMPVVTPQVPRQSPADHHAPCSSRCAFKEPAPLAGRDQARVLMSTLSATTRPTRAAAVAAHGHERRFSANSLTRLLGSATRSRSTHSRASPERYLSTERQSCKPGSHGSLLMMCSLGISPPLRARRRARHRGRGLARRRSGHGLGDQPGIRDGTPSVAQPS